MYKIVASDKYHVTEKWSMKRACHSSPCYCTCSRFCWVELL